MDALSNVKEYVLLLAVVRVRETALLVVPATAQRDVLLLVLEYAKGALVLV